LARDGKLRLKKPGQADWVSKGPPECKSQYCPGAGEVAALYQHLAQADGLDVGILQFSAQAARAGKQKAVLREEIRSLSCQWLKGSGCPLP
jgi:hypothetical protein